MEVNKSGSKNNKIKNKRRLTEFEIKVLEREVEKETKILKNMREW